MASVIPAIVLAAGRSSRMGRAKASLPLDGTDTFLTRIVRTFHEAGIDDVIVVVGHEAEEIARGFSQSGVPARFVVNANYDRGQLSSLLAGLAVIDRPGVTAALVTLVDVPLVSASTVRAVVDRYRTSRARVVRPTSGARHGHPLLIDRSLFDELRRADPSEGPKPVVRAYASREGDLEIADEGAFTDIDTEEDYRQWISRSSGGADEVHDRGPTRE
jgi:molybdenum cofactor cytidylyltransferase